MSASNRNSPGKSSTPRTGTLMPMTSQVRKTFTH